MTRVAPSADTTLEPGPRSNDPVRVRYVWLLLAVGVAALIGLVATFWAIFGWSGAVEPVPRVSGLIHYDCVWLEHPTAWIDMNSNGHRDPEDGPLQGVKFELLDLTHDGKVLGSPETSDADGHATVRQGLWGCPAIELALRAVPPAGYRNTTSPVLPEGSEFSYGFASAR